ncbi:hypothetical protein CYY_009860 [Polysphondylium violaceum]|uniref:G-protein coupled receptors family 2 profile 2 domain-containing protein n=1 Tax=Polysphondylium violaceum TaxID=133409 RepID=A0A8J4V065_9MYCE|nr:hypothetical protein CYY_009860 [Polysphondylium violaceum]
MGVDEVYKPLGYIVDVFLALSIAGSFLTVFTFMLFHKLRTYPIRLILNLCMAIFFAQLFFFISFKSFDSMFCLTAGMLLHFFFLADFIWTFCVAFNFYQMIVKRNRDVEAFEKYYHIASWGIPMVIVVFCAGFGQYSNRGNFCYLNEAVPVFVAFFIPGLLVVCSNAVLFFFIAREIHDTLKNAAKTERKDKSKQFRVYFSIFASIGLSWIFGFVMTFFSEGVLNVVFLVLFSVTTPLQGALIFASYCLNDKVIRSYASLFSKIIPFCKRWENYGTSIQTSSTQNLSTVLGRSSYINKSSSSLESDIPMKNLNSSINSNNNAGPGSV